MSKESDLSGKWLEAWQLRRQAKNIVLNGGGNLTDELERQMFQEADERIDSYYVRKRKNQPNPQSEEEDLSIAFTTWVGCGKREADKKPPGGLHQG